MTNPSTAGAMDHAALLAAASDGWVVAFAFLMGAGYFWWRWKREQKRSVDLLSQLELTTQRRKLVIQFLHDLGEGFVAGVRLDPLLQRIVQFSVSTTQAHAGAIFLFDTERKNLRARIVIGPFPPPVRPAEFNEARFVGKPEQLERLVRAQDISIKEGLIGEVASTGKSVLVRNGKIEQRLPHYTEPALQIRNAIVMPMKFGEEVMGVMVVVNKESPDGQSFNGSDVFLLDSLATHGAISLHNFALYQQQERQLLMEADMRVASEIQRMLLPDQAPEVENFELYALNHAAQHVSGDYYDFIRLDDSHVGVVIADVSGKAVSGALVMATCRSILRTQCASSMSPASVLRQVNRMLLADLPEDMFVTLTYGVLDGMKRTFTFARAGHDPALLYTAATREVSVVHSKGVAVGLTKREHFERELEEKLVSLAAGDILALYTDGITESLDAHEEEFGRDRLAAAIRDAAEQPAAEISEKIIDRLDDFTENTPPMDDRTLIIIKAL